jgi:threonine/homoserine/homoserine lactone efflux protein
MFSTLLKVAGIAAIGYIGFQVGRHWDEISAEMETLDPPTPTEPTVVVDSPMPPAGE